MSTETKTMTLATALFAVRQEIGTIKKESENPFFHSKYADLPSILEAVDPLLVKHGILLLQPVVMIQGLPAVETRLVLVESGAQEQSFYPLPGPEEPQKFAAALTYARRCSIVSLLALNVDEDDDGNLASQPSSAPARASNSPQARPQAQAKPSGSGKATMGVCPYCKAQAVIRGKAEFGGGWLCWKREGGCGTKFDADPAQGAG